MYNFMSLKLRTRNHPSLQGCFSAMPLIPVPIWGLNVLKTVEIAIWRKGRTTWMELERVFCHWNYFHFSSKIFYGRLTGGDRLHGSVTDWDFSQSQSYTCWQHLAVKSTSHLGLLCGSLWTTRFHTRTCCPSMNKSKVQSRAASGTFPLKLIAKTLRYQDASFPAWNCQLANRTVQFAITVTAP